MKARKILVSLAALALVAAISIGGTLAYLTDKGEVTNTFTVGKLDIVLNEAKTDVNGVADTTADRVYANQYKIMPGHTYAKDPAVFVQPSSEASYIFIAVKNELGALEATQSNAYDTIATQITNNGWTEVTDALKTGTVADDYTVYYKVQTATNDKTTVKLDIFKTFKIADKADEETNYGDFDGKIIVLAYAVQQDGFNSYADAWEKAGFTVPATTTAQG